MKLAKTLSRQVGVLLALFTAGTLAVPGIFYLFAIKAIGTRQLLLSFAAVAALHAGLLVIGIRTIRRYLAERRALEAERDRLVDGLRDSRDEMGRQVEAQTAELKAANEQLQGEILDRQHMRQVLREREELLQGLITHLPEGVFLLDGRRRLVTMNPAAQEYQPLLMETTRDDVVLRVGDYGLEDLLALCKDGPPHEIVAETSPRRTFEIQARPITKGRTEGWWVLSAREVTQERDVQERMNQQYRLVAVGQLAAGIAHDFNNLLTVMMGIAQLLEAQQETPEHIKESLRTISTQGERAAQLIRQILDFSRQSIVKQQRADLVPFLKEAIKLLERTLPETIRIIPEFDALEYVINANLAQLQQVITNLAVNARDAMPEGGKLYFRLTRLQLTSAQAPPFPQMAPGDWVVWTVSDTGAGIPPEALSHIFEPFFTTKSPGQGTGLGLAQVYGIVKQHKGFINVESEAGKGTTFTIYLPLLSGKEAAPRKAAPQVHKGRGETVLVVEDEEDVRTLIKSMLEDMNYRVIVAKNGREALDTYDRKWNEIALVMTDMVMPEMGGIELFRALKEKNPGARVVMITGYAPGRWRQTQPPEEIDALLEKPLTLSEVAQTLNQVLEV